MLGLPRVTTPFDRTRRRFAVDDAAAILARTPATLDALLRGLPDGWIAANEGDDTFSPFDVVGHLIHGERVDWVPRARIILEHGDARAFDDHIVQISRVLARQYSDEVGPWRAYLRVIRD